MGAYSNPQKCCRQLLCRPSMQAKGSEEGTRTGSPLRLGYCESSSWIVRLVSPGAAKWVLGNLSACGRAGDLSDLSAGGRVVDTEGAVGIAGDVAVSVSRLDVGEVG